MNVWLFIFGLASIGGGLVAYLQSAQVGWRALGMFGFAGGAGAIIVALNS